MVISRRQLLGSGAAFTVSLVMGKRAFAAPANPVELTRKDAYTFIVAGLDTRNVEDPENSDVLMLARVIVSSGIVRAVSIPRDLYVDIPGYGYDKINRAYDYGSKAEDHDWNAGIALTDQTIAANLGVDADAAVTTTFAGISRIVDAVGGVTVNNPYDVRDDLFRAEDGTVGVFFPAGKITLDGPQTVSFCRTRNQDGDDGRVMRQQLVLTALLARITSPSMLPKLPRVIEATRAAVTTNIPVAVQTQLATSLGNFSSDKVVFGTFTDQLVGGLLDNGMWVYQADWSTLPGWIQAFLDGTI